MDAKLDKISELSNILCEKDGVGQKIVAVGHEFCLGKLMRQAHISKQQGVPCSALLLYLLLIRLLEISVFCFYKSRWFGLLSMEIGKNCFYRFLSNPCYNWRSLLLGVAKQFLRIVERRGGSCDDTPSFYIMDDTTLEKSGIHFEGLSRVYDHTDGRHKLGYKLLTFSFFDGKSSIPLDCSLHAEKGRKVDYSLSASERKGLFRKKRDAGSSGYKRKEELDDWTKAQNATISEQFHNTLNSFGKTVMDAAKNSILGERKFRLMNQRDMEKLNEDYHTEKYLRHQQIHETLDLLALFEKPDTAKLVREVAVALMGGRYVNLPCAGGGSVCSETGWDGRKKDEENEDFRLRCWLHAAKTIKASRYVPTKRKGYGR